MARRGMSAAERRRVRQAMANRRIGYEWAYLIEFGPYLGRFAVLVAAVGGLMWLWLHIPHVVLGGAALTCAAVVGGAWLVWTGSTGALQRRMAARAKGGDPRGTGLGWAVAGLCILLAGVGWVSLWSPWA
jgi:hypothetical protein